jgi:hypothetical protein
VHHERHRVDGALVADGVRRVPGQRHDVARAGDHPPDRAVVVAEIEGELALEHVVDLAGRVPVHDGRPAARWHAGLDGEDGAAGLRRGREDRELVGAENDPLGFATIDR